MVHGEPCSEIRSKNPGQAKESVYPQQPVVAVEEPEESSVLEVNEECFIKEEVIYCAKTR